MASPAITSPEDDLILRAIDGDPNVQLVNPPQGASMSDTNLPDVRNMPSEPGAEMVSDQTMAATKFRQAAERPGVELDTESGAPAWFRLGASAHREKVDELAFWRSKYGQDKVDVVNGRFILRGITDENGKARDILVDEESLSGKDVLDAMGEMPELLLSVMTARKMAAAKFGLAAQAVGAAAAYSGLGAAKDATARKAVGQPARPAEIAVSRGLELTTDLGISSLFPAFRGIVNLARRPFGVAPGMLPIEGMNGRQFIKATTGIDIPLSLAEQTGSQPFARAESFVERIPIARRPVQRKKELKIQAIRELQEFLLDGTPPTSTEVGERTAEAVRAVIDPKLASVESSKRAAIQSAQGEAMGPIRARAGSSMSPLELGESFAKGTQGRFQAFKTEKDRLYGLVYDLPGSRQDIFPLRTVAAKAEEILKELPSVPEQAKKVKAYDQYGNPTEAVVPGKSGEREPIAELIKSDLLSRMQALSERKGQKTRLFDLVQMRDRIWDLVTPGAIQDIPTHDLKELSAAITATIEQTAKGIPGDLGRRLVQANKHYKTGITKFEQSGIVELLKTEGGLASKREALVSSIFASGKGSAGRYNQYKKFFGAGSSEIKGLRQYFLDNIAERAVNPVTRAVDFKDVLSSVTKLTPELRKDLFGAAADNMEDAARLGLVAEGKVSWDEVKNLITTNRLTVSRVKKLLADQKALDSELRNQVKSAVKEGFIDSSKINPDELVQRYIMDTSIPANDVREVMKILQNSDDFTLVRDVRRKVLEDMFRKSQKGTISGGVGGEDVTRRVLGDVTREIDPQKLSLMFDKRENVERLREVLSPKQLDVVSALVKVGGASAKTESLAGAAGAFESGSILKDLITGFTGVADIAKYYTLGWALTDDHVIRLLNKQRSPVEMKKAMEALILTPEFARALVDDIPDDLERARIAADLRNAFRKEQPAAP